MKVVVNGDDLAYTKANTLGIVQAFKEGILRSTTVLTNMPLVEWARSCVQDCSDLGLGVHLTLTLGNSLTQNKTLTHADGTFLSRTECYAAKLDPNEVYAEWKAQIDRFIAVFGTMPTHLDSHHGVHDMNECHLALAQDLAAEYGLELRRHNNRFAYVNGFGGQATAPKDLIALLEQYDGQDIEIMCHPGYCDLALYRASSYSLDRVKELAALCDSSVLDYVQTHGIELVHY